MSKRNSSTPSNTLFNYFTKTPPANKKTKSLDSDGSPALDTSKNIENEPKAESKYTEIESKYISFTT